MQKSIESKDKELEEMKQKYNDAMKKLYAQ